MDKYKPSKREDKTVKYRYRLSNTNSSSDKYGVCQVCGMHAEEVYHQTEERRYSKGWTHAKCTDIYGHKECLIKQRRLE